MPHREHPDSKAPEPGQSGTGEPGREQRPYPHGSGDRNAFSPTRKDPMPRHEGGTQRKAPTDSTPSGSEAPE